MNPDDLIQLRAEIGSRLDIISREESIPAGVEYRLATAIDAIFEAHLARLSKGDQV